MRDVDEAFLGLLQALEEGEYNTAPLRECQRQHPNDLCTPCHPDVCKHTCGAYAEHGLGNGLGCQQSVGHEGNHGDE